MMTQTITPALLSVANLRVAYPRQTEGDTVWAVDDVSFELKPGEKIGLVGESGCGKSTLGRAIMRLLPQGSQVSGQAIFQDKSVFELNKADLREFRGEVVALVFQDPMTRLDPLMTIGDHCLETIAAHQPQLTKSAAKQLAIETLETVKIPANRWRQYPHEFSGGMRQRVAIALALLLNPKVIVADEPTTSLDVTVSAEILDELTRLCSERDMALLLISHDLALVGEYCDRIAVMYQGKMVETGDVKSILYNPQHEYTKSLLDAALLLQVVDEEIAIQSKETPILRVKNLKQYFTLETNLLLQWLSNIKQYVTVEGAVIKNRFYTEEAETKVIKAVDNVSFDLYPGEILGLVGESGCGKSTLSRTILQLLKPTSGKVEFLGQDLTTLSASAMRNQRRQLQMVFQDPNACLNPLMTVGESIADPLLIHKLASPTEAKQQVGNYVGESWLNPCRRILPPLP